jgi:hypothetical protein
MIGAATTHQQLQATRGEIYTQGHYSRIYTEWDLHAQRCDYYQQLVPGENIHPGTWHSSMYISEWDLHGGSQTTTSSFSQRKYTPRDMASHV